MEPPIPAIDQLRSVYQDAVVPKYGESIGASREDVASLEASIGFTLPADYREFLLTFGKDHNGPFRGKGCFIGKIIENSRVLPGVLQGMGFPAFPPTVFLLATSKEDNGWITFIDLPTQQDDPLVNVIDEKNDPSGFTTYCSLITYFLRHLRSVCRD